MQPFEAYEQRPRESYLHHRSYAKLWINMIQEAEKQNLDSVVIIVPRAFPHWRWEGWFFEGFTHTLWHFGIIHKPIKVVFKPDS